MPDPFARFAGTGLFALRASVAREVVAAEEGKGAAPGRSRRHRARPPRPRLAGSRSTRRRGGSGRAPRRGALAHPPPRLRAGRPLRAPRPHRAPLRFPPRPDARREEGRPPGLGRVDDPFSRHRAGAHRVRARLEPVGRRRARRRRNGWRISSATCRAPPSRPPTCSSLPTGRCSGRPSRAEAPSCGSFGRPPSAPASRPRPPSWPLPLAKIPGTRLEAAALLLAGGTREGGAGRAREAPRPLRTGRGGAAPDRGAPPGGRAATPRRALLAAADAPREAAPAAFPPARRSRDPAPATAGGDRRGLPRRSRPAPTRSSPVRSTRRTGDAS